MDIRQLNVLNHLKLTEEDAIRGNELNDQTNRTLLFGYSDGATHHTYLKDGIIYKVEYVFTYAKFDSSLIKEIPLLSNNDFLCAKLYPESCDFEFCSLLIKKGMSLRFLSYDEIRAKKYENVAYVGLIAQDSSEPQQG